MKTKLFLLLALLATAVWAATYTRQNARVVRVQLNTEFQGATGNALTVQCDAFLQTRVLVNDADSSDVAGTDHWVAVRFDLLDPEIASTNITAAGRTVTYQQLAALIRQAALDRATAQGVQ